MERYAHVPSARLSFQPPILYFDMVAGPALQLLISIEGAAFDTFSDIVYLHVISYCNTLIPSDAADRSRSSSGAAWDELVQSALSRKQTSENTSYEGKLAAQPNVSGGLATYIHVHAPIHTHTCM